MTGFFKINKCRSIRLKCMFRCHYFSGNSKMGPTNWPLQCCFDNQKKSILFWVLLEKLLSSYLFLQTTSSAGIGGWNFWQWSRCLFTRTLGPRMKCEKNVVAVGMSLSKQATRHLFFNNKLSWLTKTFEIFYCLPVLIKVINLQLFDSKRQGTKTKYQYQQRHIYEIFIRGF